MVRPAFINPPISDSQRGRWKRESLFDAERGSIGLAWSIFKARGTPNNINWSVRPYFHIIPSSYKFIVGTTPFINTTRVDIQRLAERFQRYIPGCTPSRPSHTPSSPTIGPRWCDCRTQVARAASRPLPTTDPNKLSLRFHMALPRISVRPSYDTRSSFRTSLDTPTACITPTRIYEFADHEGARTCTECFG